MILLRYEKPTSHWKTRERVFFNDVELRAFIKTMRICYGESWDLYSWIDLP
jgi:hypothetical protein